MHEISLMQDMLNLALDQASQHGAHRITCVTVRIGEESGVSPDVISFAFATLTRETMAEDAHLVIESVPVICDCPACGVEFHPEDALHVCPGCGRVGAPVRSGREFQIVALDVS